ncbi:MAG: 50S ribosomal protein L6 [Candidatus Iainarchaeum archaeon]|uniref:50S ribosomal protein L6 n=1 Tax=Candidatus Iainarchaeum sp. TaxID=3101447 RepID=A0A497JHT2_9ARCH|nr:MAG: 50S ribosomal protein L6 [Candidatus Diapherotrites archaeon]
MEKRIALPEGFEAEVKNSTIMLRYGGKEEKKSFRTKNVEIEVEDSAVVVKGVNEKRKTNAIVNTIAKHIRNLIEGLSRGYEYKMRIIHSHFPMNVQVSGKEVIITNFTGEKKPRKAKIIGENTTVQVKGKDVIIRGTNKEHVGQTAANIELATRVKRKDLRIFQDGIYLVERGLVEHEQK